jgi:hypothetical protein
MTTLAVTLAPLATSTNLARIDVSGGQAPYAYDAAWLTQPDPQIGFTLIDAGGVRYVAITAAVGAAAGSYLGELEVTVTDALARSSSAVLDVAADIELQQQRLVVIGVTTSIRRPSFFVRGEPGDRDLALIDLALSSTTSITGATGTIGLYVESPVLCCRPDGSMIFAQSWSNSTHNKPFKAYKLGADALDPYVFEEIPEAQIDSLPGAIQRRELAYSPIEPYLWASGHLYRDNLDDTFTRIIGPFSVAPGSGNYTDTDTPGALWTSDGQYLCIFVGGGSAMQVYRRNSAESYTQCTAGIGSSLSGSWGSGIWDDQHNELIMSNQTGGRRTSRFTFSGTTVTELPSIEAANPGWIGTGAGQSGGSINEIVLLSGGYLVLGGSTPTSPAHALFLFRRIGSEWILQPSDPFPAMIFPDLLTNFDARGTRAWGRREHGSQVDSGILRLAGRLFRHDGAGGFSLLAQGSGVRARTDMISATTQAMNQNMRRMIVTPPSPAPWNALDLTIRFTRPTHHYNFETGPSLVMSNIGSWPARANPWLHGGLFPTSTPVSPALSGYRQPGPIANSYALVVQSSTQRLSRAALQGPMPAHATGTVGVLVKIPAVPVEHATAFTISGAFGLVHSSGWIQFGYRTVSGEARPAMTFRSSTGGTTAAENRMRVGNVALPLDTWIWLFFDQPGDGSNIVMTVNTTVQAYTTTGSQPVNAWLSMVARMGTTIVEGIGNVNGITAGSSEGMAIAEVCVWNRVLSAPEKALLCGAAGL